MAEENKIFTDSAVTEAERKTWPLGEAVNLSDEIIEEKDEQEENLLSGVNRTAMADALAQIAEQEEEKEAANFFRDNKKENGVLFASEDEPIERHEPIEETAAIWLENHNDSLEGQSISLFRTEVIAQPSESPETKPELKDETIVIPKSKFELIKKILKNIKESSCRLEDLLSGSADEEQAVSGIAELMAPAEETEENSGSGEEKIIEGVFNGQHMIGPDGRQYSIPPNYASKSKLVEGDILKLTIKNNGKFIYKQIGPIERERVSGLLAVGKNGDYFVERGSKRWHILTASVTYFKGQPDDEAVILVPKYGDSNWAAVENIISSQ